MERKSTKREIAEKDRIASRKRLVHLHGAADTAASAWGGDTSAGRIEVATSPTRAEISYSAGLAQLSSAVSLLLLFYSGLCICSLTPLNTSTSATRLCLFPPQRHISHSVWDI
ncbi:hypothetical protein J6590_014129 [Homalodisca vitripennis]|nr:hypothetical protein J6590_014129 [Homalodisca vitripennis]